MKDEQIIVRAEVFEEDYLPENVLFRENEIKFMFSTLNSFKERGTRANLFLYGPPGTGKTTVIKKVFEELESKNFVCIYINCWTCNKPHAVLTKILKYLDPFASFKRTENELLEDIIKQRENKRCRIVVCLDEVDRIIDDSTLYILARNSFLLVLISNDKFALAKLDARTKSSIMPVEIEFKKYSVDEIKSILKNRAKIGLRPGALKETSLRMIAVASKGDARKAISLLKTSALFAENAGKDRIDEETVAKAIKMIKDTKYEEIIQNLKKEEAVLLEIIKEYGVIEGGKLYKEFCARYKSIPERTFRWHLKKLVDMNAVKSEGKVRWRKYIYNL